MRTILSFFKLELGSTHHDFVPMLHKIVDDILQVQKFRPTIDKRDIVDTERGLKGRVLVQHVEYNIGNGVTLQNINDTHPIPVGLIPNGGYPLYFLFVDQIGGLFDHVRLVDLVRDFGNNDAFLPLNLFNSGLGTHHNTSTTCMESFFHAIIAINQTSCWKIRGLDVRNQFIYFYIMIVYVRYGTVNDLGKIVRWHIGGHTYGNTRSSVYQ